MHTILDYTPLINLFWLVIHEKTYLGVHRPMFENWIILVSKGNLSVISVFENCFIIFRCFGNERRSFWQLLATS